MDNKIQMRAYAKINLALDVLRRRPDGYHDVRMIMQTVDLYDEIMVSAQKEKGITLTCNVPGVPSDARNLAHRAAALLMEAYVPDAGIAINIKKRIPAAAGMAGGSSDAAAVLKAVNDLFSLGLDNARLAAYGIQIGADVPYCIYGGTMRAEGIGEKLTRLPAMPACGVLIAKPDISVSTKYVYENLHAEWLTAHPDIFGMEADIARGDVQAVARGLGNVLETVTVPAYPVIGAIKQVMEENGALGALMSGSGPTVFGLFMKKEDGQAAYRAVLESGMAKDLFLTSLCDV